MPKSHSAPIRIGIGGWTYEPWRGLFYPEGLAQRRELEYASRQLDTIEINGTYYGSQKPESFAKRHDETPEDFVFAVKGPRFTTNRRVLAEAGASVERFLTSGLSELKGKLGPINWQFLPTKKLDLDDFAAFLKLLPKTLDGLKLRHAVEVRHESFRTPDFIDLLREHGVAAIIGGDSDHPQIADITADFVYARIMGTGEAHPQGYAPRDLDRWAARAQTWAGGDTPKDLSTLSDKSVSKTPRDVFLYVISGFKAHNPAAAKAMRALRDGTD